MSNDTARNCHQVTPGSVLPVATATSLLPGAPDDVLAWLEEQGLIVELLGSPVVIWGDVLIAIRGERQPKPVVPAGAVISEDRAARALPWRRQSAVRWLREEQLSVPVDGRRVVAWDAVVDRLRPPSPPSGPRRSRRGPAVKPLAKPGRILG